MKLYTTMRRLGLVEKVLIMFICFILLPVVIITLIYTRDVDNKAKQEELWYFENNLRQANTMLSDTIEQANSACSILQSNSSIIDYLHGYYVSEGEMLSVHLSKNRPLVNSLYTILPMVKHISLYSLEEQTLKLMDEVYSCQELEKLDCFDEAMELQNLSVLWKSAEVGKNGYPEFVQYKKLFGSSYLTVTGIAAVTMKSAMFDDIENLLYSSNPNITDVYIMNQTGKVWGSDISDEKLDRLNQMNTDAHYGTDENYHFYGNGDEEIGSYYNSALGIYLMVEKKEVTPPLLSMNSDNKGVYYILGVMLVMMTIFIALYFGTFSGRILKLTRHLTHNSADNPTEYTGKGGNDEVGQIIDTYNRMVRWNMEMADTVQKAEILRREAEYAALQSQIKPHFIYGTLESVRMLAMKNGDKEVEEMIIALANLMRYSLPTGRDKVTLQNEVDHVTNYLTIQKMRFGKRLEYDINVQCEADKIMALPFMLQPLVENALKHGAEQTLEICRIAIDVRVEENNVRIDIKNTGALPAEDRLAEVSAMLNGQLPIKEFATGKSGYAMYNIHERMRAQFGTDAMMCLRRDGLKTVCALSFERRSLC